MFPKMLALKCLEVNVMNFHVCEYVEYGDFDYANSRK